MKKAKKTKVPTRKSRLDTLASKLRIVLRRETLDNIEVGKILLEIRNELGHGEWLPWLAENFDLSERTAQRYIADAEYVASKSDTVSDFANLAPGVLRELAAGCYDEKEEAAILAATREGRVDDDRVSAICDALADAEDEADGDTEGDDSESEADKAAEDDPEIKAMLDGPPPDVPPPAPDLAPINYALRSFDEAVRSLQALITKPLTTFSNTTHSADDLEKIERFIGDVSARKRSAPAVQLLHVGGDNGEADGRRR